MKTSRQSTQWLVLSAAVVLPVAILVASCAHFLDAGPSKVSQDGVRLTIRDFECLQGDPTGDPKQGADLVIDLEIQNRSHDALPGNHETLLLVSPVAQTFRGDRG